MFSRRPLDSLSMKHFKKPESYFYCLVVLLFASGFISCTVGLFMKGISTHYHLLFLAVIYGAATYGVVKAIAENERN